MTFVKDEYDSIKYYTYSIYRQAKPLLAMLTTQFGFFVLTVGVTRLRDDLVSVLPDAHAIQLPAAKAPVLMPRCSFAHLILRDAK